MKKTRWFVKPKNDITNESIHNWLARTSSHQDGIASQEILVRDKKELLIEVPSYDLIRNLYESMNNVAFFKFEAYIIPPGARQAGPWALRDFQKKPQRKLSKNLTPQAKT